MEVPDSGLCLRMNPDVNEVELSGNSPLLLQRLLRKSQNSKQIGARIPAPEEDNGNVQMHRKWDYQLTKSLIKIRKQLDSLFKINVERKQKHLWDEVLMRMLKEERNNSRSLHITSADCAENWKCLLATYNSNYVKSQQYGEKAVTWEHYDTIHELMNGETTSEFSKLAKNTLGTSSLTDKPKKLFIEKTLQFCPNLRTGENPVTIVNQQNFQPGTFILATPVHDTQSAEQCFGRFVAQELEKLPPEVKKRKKQRILLVLYE